jgi:hypothetical protein
MKFKEGDRVRIKYGSFNDEFEGQVGTCILDPVHDLDGAISIEFDNYKLNEYYSETLDKSISNYNYHESDLELLELPYTKITEKLMKGKINYIKDGIIYLK